MKATKLDLLLADLQSERKWTDACAECIKGVAGSDSHDILHQRVAMLDELIERLMADAPVVENKLTRTRKPRKAGLSEVSK